MEPESKDVAISQLSSTNPGVVRRLFFAIARRVQLMGLMHRPKETDASVFIASVKGYSDNIRDVVLRGFKELGIGSAMVSHKSILLKPNMVEPHRHAPHINTHPLVIRAVAEAFFVLGAETVTVAEGAGHRRDTYLILEESGMAQVLAEDRIPFVDLNSDEALRTPNKGKRSKLGDLYLPKTVASTDMVVSIAKMKTHHWVGATLSMKNLFGIMPGAIYGWPKNVLHWAGIAKSIFDITATAPVHLGIVDGIVGMEGDGPIMGDPVDSRVLAMGRNLPALDATCARVMGLNPQKIAYLKAASPWLGSISEDHIHQLGEAIESVRTDFRLIDSIPVQRGLRL